MAVVTNGAAPSWQRAAESQQVMRNAPELAACLACDICTGILQEPFTAPDCMHCYCRACISAFLNQSERKCCPVCRVAGVDTSFGADPMRDSLRADLTLQDILRKVGKDLGPDDLKEAARIDQWHALNLQVQAEQAAMAEPLRVVRPPRNQLPSDGRGCIELLVNSLSDEDQFQLENPYIRTFSNITVERLARFVQERLFSVQSPRLRVQLSCRGQSLPGSAILSDVAANSWIPHVQASELLELDMVWFRTPDPSPEPEQ